jgi:hypothetical protein
VTADAMVLDRCGEWANLARALAEAGVPTALVADLRRGRTAKRPAAGGLLAVATGQGHVPDADAFFGKFLPRLQWVQAPTAGLEHYRSPELGPTRAC